MRRLLAWLAGGVAGAAALRALRARLRQPAPTPIAERDPRAEELRRKLAESRALVQERDEFEDRELTVDRAEPAGDDVADRRRRVHEHGRAEAEEMRGD